jgi:hypothetical protein
VRARVGAPLTLACRHRLQLQHRGDHRQGAVALVQPGQGQARGPLRHHQAPQLREPRRRRGALPQDVAGEAAAHLRRPLPHPHALQLPLQRGELRAAHQRGRLVQSRRRQ